MATPMPVRRRFHTTCVLVSLAVWAISERRSRPYVSGRGWARQWCVRGTMPRPGPAIGVGIKSVSTCSADAMGFSRLE